MTTRRQFLKGSVAAAVAASLPAAGDGVELYSATHPVWKDAVPHAPALLPVTGDSDTGMYRPSSDQLELVAGGLRQLKEEVAAKVFKEAFNE